MIIGVDTSAPSREPVTVTFGDDAAAGRAWCYSGRARKLYEVNGKLTRAPLDWGRHDLVALECDRSGRLLTTYQRAQARQRRSA